MASTFSYYAPEDEPPCPLPSKEQILESKELLLVYSARKVVGIGSEFIVKYGLAVGLTEGENLLFTANFKNSSVRAPKVYAVYEDSGDKTRYIIMERIHSHLLSSIWPTLTRPQKELICAKINFAMDTLRKIPSPSGYCSLNRRPLQDAVFWSGDDTPFLEWPIRYPRGTQLSHDKKNISSTIFLPAKQHFMNEVSRKFYTTNLRFSHAEIYNAKTS